MKRNGNVNEHAAFSDVVGHLRCTLDGPLTKLVTTLSQIYRIDIDG